VPYHPSSPNIKKNSANKLKTHFSPDKTAKSCNHQARSVYHTYWLTSWVTDSHRRAKTEILLHVSKLKNMMVKCSQCDEETTQWVPFNGLPRFPLTSGPHIKPVQCCYYLFSADTKAICLPCEGQLEDDPHRKLIVVHATGCCLFICETIVDNERLQHCPRDVHSHRPTDMALHNTEVYLHPLVKL
jgi:hypothetical protein